MPPSLPTRHIEALDQIKGDLFIKLRAELGNNEVAQAITDVILLTKKLLAIYAKEENNSEAKERFDDLV